jgi:L-fuconolactonase
VEKRLDGRDEPILDPEIPIIDAHHHLGPRPTGKYMFEDFLDDAGAGHNIRASVYVESRAMFRQDGPAVLRPVGEIEFANGVGAMAESGYFGGCRVAAAIVGFADLTIGEGIAELLDRALDTAPDRFRGIRQPTMDHSNPAPWRYVPHRPPSGLLEHPGFRPGFAQLGPRGLSFDAAVFNHQMPHLADLAGAFPDTTVVLGHMGHVMALDMDQQERDEVFRQWRGYMADLAALPNVVCKVGGLGLPFWGFGFEGRTEAIGYEELARAWRPYVETAVETFGADRCMLESNFPADARSVGYVPLWNAFKHILTDASTDEKAALFHGTASRVYRIPSMV